MGNSLRKENLYKLWRKKIRFGFYRAKQPKTNVPILYAFQNLRDNQEHKRMSEVLSNLWILWKNLNLDFSAEKTCDSIIKWKKRVMCAIRGTEHEGAWNSLLTKWYFLLSVRFCGKCEKNAFWILQMKFHMKDRYGTKN